MKRTAFLLPLLLLALAPALPLRAQQAEGGPSQELMQRLFDPQATQEQLLEATKAAGMAGVPRQQVIEAKLVWGLRRNDVAFLTKLLPELEILAANFNAAESAGLKSADDIRSFIAYVKAIQADQKGDAEGFKTQILEAIWLNPGQAQIFTQVIEGKRRDAKMAQLKIDMEMAVSDHQGSAHVLKEVLNGKKALLVDFWASWCGPCMQLMPELKKKAAELEKHGIVVVGMNKDDGDAVSVAAKVREEKGITFPWLIEPKERPFTQLLEIDSIPRMVLISPEGKVLYNGHPQDPELWAALQKLDPAIKPAKAE